MRRDRDVQALVLLDRFIWFCFGLASGCFIALLAYHLFGGVR